MATIEAQIVSVTRVAGTLGGMAFSCPLVHLNTTFEAGNYYKPTGKASFTFAGNGFLTGVPLCNTPLPADSKVYFDNAGGGTSTLWFRRGEIQTDGTGANTSQSFQFYLGEEGSNWEEGSFAYDADGSYHMAFTLWIAKDNADTYEIELEGVIFSSEAANQQITASSASAFGTYSFSRQSRFPDDVYITSYTAGHSAVLKRVFSPVQDIWDAEIRLSPTGYAYDGQAKTPHVTVTMGGTALTENTDFTVAYSNNVEIGTALVTVTGINRYTGVKTAPFIIHAAFAGSGDFINGLIVGRQLRGWATRNTGGGYPEPSGSVTLTDNGTFNVKARETAIVALPLGAKSVTANGTYTAADDSLRGYSSVAVQVPNSYAAADEGKVVSSGALASQTSRTVAANGTYDTTENNQVTVDVPASASRGLAYNLGDYYGDTGGGEASSLVCTLSGPVGSKALLIVMHRASITVPDMELVSSTQSPEFNQIISIYQAEMAASSKSVTITQSSAVRMCACSIFIDKTAEISATPEQYKMDSSASIYTYRVPGKKRVRLAVVNNAYAGGATATLAPQQETLPGNFLTASQTVRLCAFILPSIADTTLAINTTYDPTSGAANRMFVYDILVPELEPAGTITITENGTYDVTDKAQAVVHVPGASALAWRDTLSVNWDFANPVNTRGGSAYSSGGASALIYTIDGWQLQGGTLAFAAGGIKLSQYTSGTNGYFMQRYKSDAVAAMIGKTLTLSAIVDNVLYSGTAALTSGAGGKLTVQCGGARLRIYMYGGNEFAVTIDILSGQQDRVYRAIKLEAGATQTLATQSGGALSLNNSMDADTEYIKARNGMVYNG